MQAPALAGANGGSDELVQQLYPAKRTKQKLVAGHTNAATGIWQLPARLQKVERGRG